MANLLIVDDEQSYRQLLTLVFGSDRHIIHTAASGTEALQVLQKERIQVLISDVRLPDMDGIQVLRLAREAQPDIGVVMITALRYSRDS